MGGNVGSDLGVGGVQDVVDVVRSGTGVIDTLDVLVRVCVDRVGAAEAAIMITDAHGGLRAVASSNERTLDVEEAQIGTREGICVECVRTGRVVEVPDIEEVSHLWPEFAATARDAGFRAGLAVPLSVGDRTIGGVNLFFSTSGYRSLPEIAQVQAMVQVAALSAAPQEGSDDHADLNQLLDDTVAARTVIEQAKGYLAYDRNMSIGDSYGLMREHADRHRVGVAEVAERVLGGQLVI